MFHSWQTAPGLGGWKDILLNIAIYIPVGLLAALKLRNRPALTRFGVPLLLGSGLSLAVECMQVYDVSRFPSGLDWVTNTAGTALGILAAWVMPHLFLGPMDWAEMRIRRSPAASLLLAAWLAWMTFPWIPYLSLYGWGKKLTMFLVAPWPFVTLLSCAVTYLALGLLLREVSRRHAMLALVIAVLMVPGQILLLGRQPFLVELVGALAGLAAFTLLRRHAASVQIGASAFCAVVMLRGLQPFHFSMSPTPFEWTPLLATLSFDRPLAALKLLEKCAWYGTPVWLLERAGYRRWLAAGTIAVMLGMIEFVQRWLPGRTPEITDPLLALAMTGLFVWAERWGATHPPVSADSAKRRTR